ncbi:MAG: Rossmann fold nucleotide-binding protein DprA involved in DNA uptake [Candidatus Woesebacteria bacterium]|nr:MAG: Rossmann fold nucleotide-binding protein DprA involved in DNA uptake [Candidatus Woesebacteria bacterium]
MTEKNYLIALSAFVPFGPVRLSLLLSYFKTAKKVWSLSLSDLAEVGIKEKLALEFISFRDNFNIEAYLERLKKFGIDCVIKGEENYPKNLAEIDSAPLVLYVKGSLKSLDTESVAIVGSRKMTSYGREVAEKFAYEISQAGVTIISGLARGIDTVAHKSALEGGGRTIAVVGSGLNRIYPPENTNLALSIAKDGALISEYPLDYPALRLNFAARNRIISGLSKIVLVIEGAEKSGTLLTASHAAEQGRTVFAVPGQITSPLSFAPHFLIQNGAKIAFSPRDIISELDLQFKVDTAEVEKVMPKDKEEEKILLALESEPLHLDEIARICSFSVSLVSSKLIVMEMKGMVKSLGSGIYKKL